MSATWYTLTVAALFIFSHSPAKTPWVEAIGAIRRSVVPVVCGYIDKNGKWTVADIEGTGFFIDRDGRFATASHVLDGLDAFEANTANPRCLPSIYIPQNGWGQFSRVLDINYFVFGSCTRDAAIDIAICTPITNPFANLQIKQFISEVEFNSLEMPDGTPEAFTGFPLQRTTPVTSVGIIGGKLTITDSDPWFFYMIDKAAWPGASGSPVYTQDGKVVGIVLRTGEEKAAGFGLVRCSSAIVDFISKHPTERSKHN